jgi:glycosyltransferase involved in cell wall biosynthesis
MRVALITDALDQPTRGNHTTVRRWLALCPDELSAYEAREDASFDPVPDVFHGYHAWRGGRAARALARRFDRPLVVSLGGTDVWELRRGGPRAPTIASVLEDADLVTGAFPSFATDGPYAVVPRSVEIPASVAPERPTDALRALLPSGLRPEKDIELALRLVRELRARGVPLKLRIAGPRLDEPYAARVVADAERLADVTIDEIPPAGMGAAYRAAHVVWNTSLFEGGANALLEGAAAGCALFARDVPGNRDLLSEPGAPDALFDPDDLDRAEALHRATFEEDPLERWARARSWLARWHAPGAEATALRACWRRVAEHPSEL